ncbi:MAG TPA: ParB/RepB/Spo0J family partition protein [Pirellulales bacterium]|jgi:ParB family chromosome partitioning protein
MQPYRKISILEIDRDKDQPRKNFDEAELLALGQNIKAHGQQVPVILYPNDGRLTLADGERRWRAAKLVGIDELLVIVLPQKPSLASLRILQMSLDAHRVSLSLWERSCLLRRIREETSCSVSELAAQVHMKQPLVSKLLAYQRLDPSIQHMLHGGAIDGEKALIISQEPDLQRQRELAILAAELSREQLRRTARPVDEAKQPRAKRAAFVLNDGRTVTVQGPEATLADTIDCLMEAVKKLKRCQADQLDITAAQRFMRDKARANRVLAQKNAST